MRLTIWPPSRDAATAPRVAEFFAGVGLVRMALEQTGFKVVFANDIDPTKERIYAANFSPSPFICGDIRHLRGADIPDVELATASFPCTDLSLAGNRAGLEGSQSGVLSEFLRVIREMGPRKPAGVLLENVIGFATSKSGDDIRSTIASLNELGYVCDILTLDAKQFVPQSRPRLFIVASERGRVRSSEWLPSEVRPKWVFSFARKHPELDLAATALPALPKSAITSVSEIVERFHPNHEIWWDTSRQDGFLRSLSEINSKRLALMRQSTTEVHATAYRRTRHGVAVWEIRADRLSGCLRTARGGSSKQAVVEAGNDQIRVRWMTAREYARLQGAPDFSLPGVSESQGKFALGDAVCVPVVSWLAEHYLKPLLGQRSGNSQTESLLKYG
ncbi:MAG: DNA (cytosine-5-)-methyltransferase [SAR202 cluster bacterium]|nr:DNA (cytosine-5-)-methyltransferase [SAR202 cluster bacterium]